MDESEDLRAYIRKKLNAGTSAEELRQGMVEAGIPTVPLDEVLGERAQIAQAVPMQPVAAAQANQASVGIQAKEMVGTGPANETGFWQILKSDKGLFFWPILTESLFFIFLLFLHFIPIVGLVSTPFALVGFILISFNTYRICRKCIQQHGFGFLYSVLLSFTQALVVATVFLFSAVGLFFLFFNSIYPAFFPSQIGYLMQDAANANMQFSQVVWIALLGAIFIFVIDLVLAVVYRIALSLFFAGIFLRRNPLPAKGLVLKKNDNSVFVLAGLTVLIAVIAGAILVFAVFYGAGASGAFEAIKAPANEEETTGQISGDGFNQLDLNQFTAKEEFTHAMVSPAIAIGLFVFALTVFIALAVLFRSKRERKKYEKQHIIARIFLHPAFWAFEILIAVLDVWQLFTLNYSPTAVAYYIDSFIISGVFALVFPAVFLIVIWLADVYEREPLRFVFSMLLWGLVASAIALVVNTSIFTPIRQAGGLAFLFLAIVIAPVVEELSKGLGIFAISKHSEMNGALDGIVYGFSIGLGFALTENWLYFSNYSPASLGIELSAWVFLLFYRSIFSCLGHGWITATTGAVMGFFKERSGKSSLLFFLPAVAAAIILHGMANFSTLPDAIASAAAGSEVIFFSPLADIGMTVVFGAIIFAYSREARKKAQLEEKKPSEHPI